MALGSIEGSLKERGVRLTRQRQILLELIDKTGDHLDAERLYQLAKERDPKINRVTVYRTLKMLKTGGLVDELDLMHYGGDQHYYETRLKQEHAHVICLRCGKVEEFFGEPLQRLRKQIENHFGFQVLLARTEVGGYCAHCQTLRAFGLSSIGSVGGGWLSGAMLKGGRSLNVARKSALLVCAVAVLPVLYAPFAKNLWVVVGLTGLAMAAHQGWSANLFTVVSDLFPKAAVASVVGIGGMVGAIGGALFQKFTGYIVEWTHSYVPVFAVCGSSYFVALIIVHLMTPRYTPARLD